ncbi:biopolymer transporter ExbD [Marinobacter sp.]|uniref:ExbD/TolR family protein n=1 Tax=Marinobacter sp. TaxID=50741 RepID=UPI00198DFFB9|nr:biopolymer transporter ExbD [Marinobacter sp.]MBC7191529.1 biopolymer transporter ExbD [Marinobacter sp.]
MNDLMPPPGLSGKSLLDRVEDALLPLINLVFLLLMFFIVAGQLSETPLPELPETLPSGSETSTNADLTVAADGTFKMAGKPVTEAGLAEALPQPDPENPLRIGAAGNLSMAELERLMTLLEKAGYTELLLLTEPTS